MREETKMDFLKAIKTLRIGNLQVVAVGGTWIEYSGTNEGNIFYIYYYQINKSWVIECNGETVCRSY